MQTDLIIVSEYCRICHIEPSFLYLLQKGGLIEIDTIYSYVLRLVYQHRGDRRHPSFAGPGRISATGGESVEKQTEAIRNRKS